jgi:hypothetical protein
MCEMDEDQISQKHTKRGMQQHNPMLLLLLRWRIQLQEYDYEIIYKRGSQNTNEHALSRTGSTIIDVY